MDPRRKRNLWLALTVLILASLACQLGSSPEVTPTLAPTQPPAATTAPTSNAGLTSDQRTNLLLATVQIAGLYKKNGKLVVGYTGSGTIISKGGMILTNAHVADPPVAGVPIPSPEALGIALVKSEDKPADPSYFAKVLVIDGYLDLAVLQITETLDGGNVDPSKLSLSFVELGDSDNAHIGDHLNVFGFPGIGGDTITYTQGTISGFASDEKVGDRGWIKTEATISGGNSGGLGANDQGLMVGVPSAVGAGTGVSASDCRPSQDTNGDGSVDNQDFCVPISNFIGDLRPVNLAKPLIQAAKNGQAYTSPYASSGASAQGSGGEAFGKVAWYSATNPEDCQLGKQVNSYASGAQILAAVFDFSGMTNGEEWATTWMQDGQKIYDNTFTWEADESGTYTFCLNNGGDAFPDGNYAAGFYAGPDKMPLLTKGEVVVGKGTGGTAPPTSQKDVQIYGVVTDADTNKPIPNTFVVILKSGVTYDQWAQKNFGKEYVVTLTKTDKNGKYSMPVKIPRGTLFTIVFSAEGYLDKAGDNMSFKQDAPATVELDVSLTHQ